MRRLAIALPQLARLMIRASGSAIALASSGVSAASSTSSHIAKSTEPPPKSFANVSASSRGVAPLARLCLPEGVTPSGRAGLSWMVLTSSASEPDPATSSTLMASSWLTLGWRFRRVVFAIGLLIWATHLRVFGHDFSYFRLSGGCLITGGHRLLGYVFEH